MLYIYRHIVTIKVSKVLKYRNVHNSRRQLGDQAVGTVTGYSPPLRRSYHLVVTDAEYIYISIWHTMGIWVTVTWHTLNNKTYFMFCIFVMLKLARTWQYTGNNPITVTDASYIKCMLFMRYRQLTTALYHTLPWGGKKVDIYTYILTSYIIMYYMYVNIPIYHI